MTISKEQRVKARARVRAGEVPLPTDTLAMLDRLDDLEDKLARFAASFSDVKWLSDELAEAVDGVAMLHPTAQQRSKRPSRAAWSAALASFQETLRNASRADQERGESLAEDESHVVNVADTWNCPSCARERIPARYQFCDNCALSRAVADKVSDRESLFWALCRIASVCDTRASSESIVERVRSITMRALIDRKDDA